jgi:transcriptional regulatory protein GAL4
MRGWNDIIARIVEGQHKRALQDEHRETLTWNEQEATNRCLQAARESIVPIQDFWKTRPQTSLTAFFVL